MSRVYITSDLHLGHTNVLKFSNRPHDTVEEMFESLKAQWNAVVTKRDIVWILGDVAWSQQWAMRVGELNGRLRLVMGNHDNKMGKGAHKPYESVHGAVRYKGCILTHIPIHPSEFYRWRYNIHGHMHNNTIDDRRYINVNMDVTKSYVPLAFDDVLERAEKRAIAILRDDSAVGNALLYNSVKRIRAKEK